MLSALFLRSSWLQLEDDQRSMARQLRFKPTYDVLLDGVRRDYAH